MFLLLTFSADNCRLGYIQIITNVLSLLTRYFYPAGNYMFKVNNRNTRTKVWNIFKVNNKATKTTPLASNSASSVQTFKKVPKKMFPKMKKRKLLSDKFLSFTMFCSKKTSYTAKKKWLKVYKTIQINENLLVLKKRDKTPNWKRRPKFFF